MASSGDLRDQLDSIHAMSVQIAALHDMSEIHEHALGFCRALTASKFAFTGLLVDGSGVMDVAAIQGIEPVDENFYLQFHLMAVRPSVVGVPINEGHPIISNDVLHDPHSVGQPHGHPPVRSFLGVPLRVGTRMIGMIGVANKDDAYGTSDERILSTFANQVAVAIDNARLYERQREMIASLQDLHARLSEAERTRLLASERERIAGKLHDQIEQKIFSIGLGVNALLESDDIAPAASERLRKIRQVAIETADEARRAIFALAAPGHGSGDLAADVSSMLRELERRGGLEAHLVVKGTAAPELDQFQELLHSLIGEALTNVERHSLATTVLVSIRYGDDHVDVVIQDDGVGVSDLVLGTFQDSYLHFGLRHMRQQVLDLGGSFEVARADEHGTIVRLSIDLHSEIT